jgi:hypothetical protein
MRSILSWLTGIAAALKKPKDTTVVPPSAIAQGTDAEQTAAARPTIASAEAIHSQIAHVEAVKSIVGPPDQQEIKRRRDLVRGLFNDFWSDRNDKPSSFVDRLNEAEGYLNERLTASGECWQLDAEMRQMLGLPARPSARSPILGATSPIHLTARMGKADPAKGIKSRM